MTKARRRGGSFNAKPFAATLALLLFCVAFAIFAIGSAPISPLPPAGGAKAPARQVDAAPDNEASAEGADATEDDSADARLADRIALGDDPAAFEPGYVLVTLEEGASAEQAIQAVRAMRRFSACSVSEVVGNVVKVELPADVSVSEAVDAFASTDAFESAQPNYRYYAFADGSSSPQGSEALGSPASTPTGGLLASASLGDASLGSELQLHSSPNDPYYDAQWHIPNVNADKAWDSNELSRAKPTTVAVIDAGFRTDHEDLDGRVVASYDATTKRSGVALNGTTKSQVDHGTHCLGIIGAIANNGKGVAGVSGNMCKVLPVRAEDSNGHIYTSYVAQAYSYLIAHKNAYNIRVANVSLGTDSGSRVTQMTDKVLYDAIEAGRNAGIVSVVAACNDDTAVPYYAYPSDFDNVVSVIALSETTANADGVKRGSYSNYNVSGQKDKNISAPGTGILSLRGSSNGSWGTYYGTLYGTMSGTSMAAPVTSSALGLMLAANPKLKVDEAVSKLYSTARDLTKSSGTKGGWDRATGFGEVDALAAVSSAEPYLSGSARMTIGKPRTLTVKIGGVKQDPSEWTWKSSSTSIATVNAHGKVSGKKAGRVIITAKKGSLKALQLVTVRIPASSFKVVLDESSYTYNGKARKPGVTVTYKGKELEEDTDYTVSYKNNVNAGKATVTVVGASPKYTGTAKKTFKIKKASLGKARVKLSAKTLRYTGKSRKPGVAVYDIQKNKKVKLKKGSDYKVSGSAVVRGKGTLKITTKAACRNFKGSVKKSFRVK